MNASRSGCGAPMRGSADFLFQLTETDAVALVPVMPEIKSLGGALPLSLHGAVRGGVVTH